MSQKWFIVALAYASVFACALRPPLNYGFSPAVLVAAALFPVWFGAARSFVGGSSILAGGALTITSGYLLAWYNMVYETHDYSSDFALTLTFRVIGLMATVGVLLWARTVIRLGYVAATAGIGLLVFALPNVGSSPNPWKFVLSVPVTMIVLGFLHNRKAMLSIVALFVLAAVGAVFDSRSYAGLAAFTALLLVLSALRRRSGQAWNRLGITVVVVAAIGVLYNLGTGLLTQGALGEQIATRTQEQLDQSGNLIVGGRPEWMATVFLAREHPFGLGLGAQADLADWQTTREGLITAGVPTFDGYVDNYMLAEGFKLHSVVADMWMNFGLVGLGFGVLIIGLLVYSLLTHVARTGFTALHGYLILNCTWFMMFGPIYSDLPVIALGLGIVLVSKSQLRQVKSEEAERIAAAAKPPARMGFAR